MFRAGMGRVLESAAVIFVVIVGDVDRYRQSPNPPLGIGDHFLGDAHGRARNIDIFPLGDDAHGGEHAGAQGRGHQIGGAEGFALAHVVHGSVGEHCRAGGKMLRLAAQVALIRDVDLDHA